MKTQARLLPGTLDRSKKSSFFSYTLTSTTMGPTTRSASRPKASSSKYTLDREQSNRATDEPPPNEPEQGDSKRSNTVPALEVCALGTLLVFSLSSHGALFALGTAQKSIERG